MRQKILRLASVACCSVSLFQLALAALASGATHATTLAADCGPVVFNPSIDNYQCINPNFCPGGARRCLTYVDANTGYIACPCI